MPKRKSAGETGDKRGVLNLALDPKTNGLLNAACDRHKALKGPLVRSLIQWFASAPESVQQVVMGSAPRDMGEEYLAKINHYFASHLRVPKQIAHGEGPEGGRDPERVVAAGKRINRPLPDKGTEGGALGEQRSLPAPPPTFVDSQESLPKRQ